MKLKHDLMEMMACQWILRDGKDLLICNDQTNQPVFRLQAIVYEFSSDLAVQEVQFHFKTLFLHLSSFIHLNNE